jgi:hypothetical protein
MAVMPAVFRVFAHFQNLNLLALIEDLRAGRAVRSAWLSDSQLCPVAHGLPDGDVVGDLQALGQTADIGAGCDFAARRLGADPDAVRQFVDAWDDRNLGTGSLMRHLEELWAERLADAQVVQAVVCGMREPAEIREMPA